jgi:filamentous hemagglutinin
MPHRLFHSRRDPALSLCASPWVLALCGVLHIGPALAAAPLPAGTLPVAAPNFVTSGAASAAVSGSTLTINQTTARAVLNWQSFNVAPGSTVQFQQPSASAAALNRIFDANPSLIQGRLTANGQIYLINRNGIVFDGSSQINVGSLVASTLNITDANFQRGLLAFGLGEPAFVFEGNAQEFQSSLIRIESGAELRAANGGRILVFAPRIENRGLISTPDGQTVLAAGSRVYLNAPFDPSLRGFLVEVDPFTDVANPGVNLPGAVVNDSVGRIIAERGNVSLAALAVNQNGLVRATTSVRLNGSVFLTGRDTVNDGTGANSTVINGVTVARGRRSGDVTFGPGSVTEVRPELADGQTIQDSQPFTASSIDVTARRINVLDGALIAAPGGTIALTAQRGGVFQDPNATGAPARVYVATGATIDASGSSEAEVPVERNFIEIDLRGTELRDAPLQRDSFLRNSRVTVDARRGTPLTDIAPFVGQIQRGVGERTATGGSVVLRSEADLILRAGSVVDVSGGGFRYLDGFATSTQLVSGGVVFDIADASPDRVYQGFAGQYTAPDSRWGPGATIAAVPRFITGYYEGRSAGSVTLQAPALVLDGALRAQTTPNNTQRTPATAIAGGSLTLGDAAGAASGDFATTSIRFALNRPLLDPSFDPAAPIPDERLREIVLTPDSTSAAGFSRFTLFSNSRFKVDAGTDVALAPGGTFAVTAREAQIDGRISAPSGSIAITSRNTVDNRDANGNPLGAESFRVTLGATGALSAAGLWTNDLVSPIDRPIALNAGSVALSALSDVVLSTGSRVDVSAGAQISSAGSLVSSGTGGSATFASGRFGAGTRFDPQSSSVVLDGEVVGFGFAAGGRLSVATTSVRVGGTGSGAVGEFVFDPTRFGAAGFRDFALSGQDGVQVAPGAVLATGYSQLGVLPGAGLRASGGGVLEGGGSTVVPIVRPVDQRPAGNITLNALGPATGNMSIGSGAQVAVDPGGTLTLNAGRQLTVEGTLSAPAGRISLTLPQANVDDGFDPAQSIWLGRDAVLAAPGYFRARVGGTPGVREGDVLPGGSIVIDAARGYVIGVEGSRLDVSGTRATVDARVDGSVGALRVPLEVGSAGGSIALSAREGIALDSTLDARSGAPAQAEGGRLSVVLTAPALLNFPTEPRRIVFGAATPNVPVGLQPGQSIDVNALDPATTRVTGRALLDADRFAASGAGALQVRAADAVEFVDSVNLAFAQRISVDAPALHVAPGAQVRLDSTYVALGNGDPSTQTLVPAPVAGSGRLSVDAGVIDLIGRVAVSGTEKVTLNASGDIRLRGVPPNLASSLLEGSLRLQGDLELTAQRVFPTTLSAYTLDLPGTASVLAINRFGPEIDAPQSALGALTMSAHTIRQAGRVYAPFGTITLDAREQVTLDAGSVTSVSATGTVIPFGRTELSGRDYVYVVNGQNRLITALPERRITLRAPVLDAASGARVDVRGGGDLYAWEFTVGPSGSRDILDPSGTPGAFAIVPGLAGSFAPYDLGYLGSAEYRPGDRVTLSGVPGLAPGSYLRLPARYALLPGAWLVTPVAGTTDFSSPQAGVQADGSVLASGRLQVAGDDGALLQAARTSAFRVQSAAQVRTRAEYIDSFASRFFAGAADSTQTTDAARVVADAQRALVLDARFDTAAGVGGLGAQFDITAEHIAIVGAGGTAPAPGVVAISASALNALDAQSLLVGGTRSRSGDATRITVGARSLVLANDSGSTLRGSEVILAASDEVRLAAGSRLESSSSAGSSGAGRPLVVDGGDGDGALVRVASGPQVALTRNNIDRNRGDLILESGSAIRSSGSLTLDATRDHRSAAVLDLLPGTDFALGASRISAGAVSGVVDGLVLPASASDAFAALRSVTLRSYSTLDLFGPVNLGATALNRLEVEAAGIGGYATTDGQVARLAANQVVLSNPNGLAFSNAPALASGGVPSAGRGALSVEAATVILGSGSASGSAPAPFTSAGFDRATLRGTDALQVAGRGAFTARGDLRIETPRIVGADAASYTIGTAAGVAPGSGALTTARPAPGGTPPASGPVVAGAGARIALTADEALEHGTRIELPSGDATLRAAGDVSLVAGSSIDVASATRALGGVATAGAAGTVRLESVTGDVTQSVGAAIDVSGRTGANAGRLSVSAVAGDVALNGTLAGGVERGSETLAPRRAELSIDAASIGALSALNDRLNAPAAGTGGEGGFTGARVFRARTGDLEVAAGTTVRARRIEIGADAGNVDVRGRLDASGLAAGERGGEVSLSATRGSGGAGGNLTVHAGASIDARGVAGGSAGEGTAGRGGDVLLAIGNAANTLDLRTGATLDTSGAGGAAGGRVVLRAPRTGAGSGTDVAVAPVGATLTGQRETVVEAVRTFTGITSIAAGNSVGSTLGINSVNSDVAAFMAGAGAIETRLGRAADPTFRLQPGIEVQSTGALQLSSDWNLFSTSRPGGEPGILTLRAGGNLNLSGGSLSDGFTTATTAGVVQGGRSWSYRLVAGADTASADPMRTRAAIDAGNVTVGGGTARLVRTGTGSIDIAAAGDVVLANPTLINGTTPASVVYTAGAPAPALADHANPVVGGQVTAFTQDGGDLSVRAGNDVIAPAGRQLVTDWLYRQGRNNADGSVQTANRTSWWVRFSDFRQGYGTLGGGDLSIEAGRDVLNVSAVAPTSGRLPGVANAIPDASRLQVLGGGSVDVRAGGDIASGVFMSDRGELRLSAGGALRSGRTVEVSGEQFPVFTLLGLADSSARVDTRAGATLEGVFNPTILTQTQANLAGVGGGNRKTAFFTYAPDASLSLFSLGDVTLSNNPDNVALLYPLTFGPAATVVERSAMVTYPGRVKVTAFGGDLSIPRRFALYPSAGGGLDLLARGDVRIDGTIQMSDLNPQTLPQVTTPTASFQSAIGLRLIDAGPSGALVHSDPPLHAGSTEPVRIVAAEGSVVGRNDVITAILPKAVSLNAGTDLRDLWIIAQNVNDTDISRLQAGRDIVFTTRRDALGRQLANPSSIELGGPGRLELSAGRNIDLGNAVGVVTRGNLNNPFLPERGASLLLLAGTPGPDYAGFIDNLYAAPPPAADALRAEFVPNTLAYQPAARGAIRLEVPANTPLPEDLTRVDLRPAVAGYVRTVTGQAALSDDAAWQAFRTLDPALQRPLVNALLFTALRTAGQAGALSRDAADYEFGYRSIARLFPPSAVSPSGNINLFFSQLRTEQGGDIELLAPAGSVNAGLANPGGLTRSASQLGIITASGGSIRSLSDGDFLVNQSRVFTLGGGDILLWSSNGGVDAGRGARTATATPPPQIVVRGDQIVLDATNSISGSGIGVLLGRPDVVAGDVELYAPRGTIDAGDAGIRSLGRVILGGERVIIPPGAVTAGAGVTGAPAAATGAIGGLASAGAAAAGAARSAEQSATGSAAQAAQAAQNAPGRRPAFITVEVIGLGD